ncbi:TylF/MycF/NovP-related O-methyltransferase [Nocardiopsis xinjiangensis]|uniref:TylF/MycF/NovP-related O-methyltransferase n=1 Tax=Nocardiopsis xinjiangensis TaxID=124285 RepID=UPI00373AE979
MPWRASPKGGKRGRIGVSACEVRQTFLSAGCSGYSMRFIPAFVHDVLPRHAPDRIGLLRLGAGNYDSTMCELVHIYGKQSGGHECCG